MLLGADATGLEELAAACRSVGEAVRRAQRWPPALRRTGWTGRDADVVALLVAECSREAARAAAILDAMARRLGHAANRQREAAQAQAGPRSRSGSAPGPGPGRRPEVTVVERDARGDGRIVVRVGPADASAVLVVVPGVGTDQTDEARLTADAGVLWRVVSAAAEDPLRVAVVSWLGYDPPDVAFGALDPRPADVGARDLIRAVAAMRDAGAERVTVVGHSYGAVLAGRAAADGMQADALVQLGAPGVGRPGSAAAITRRGVEHLAAREADDPVRWVVPLARFVFGEDPIGRASALPTSGRGHTAYLGDAVLLEALAHIALGRGEPVRSGS